MDFFTADICDEHSDRVLVLDPEYKNYGALQKCQGEVVTIRLDKNNEENHNSEIGNITDLSLAQKRN